MLKTILIAGATMMTAPVLAQTAPTSQQAPTAPTQAQANTGTASVAAAPDQSTAVPAPADTGTSQAAQATTSSQPAAAPDPQAAQAQPDPSQAGGASGPQAAAAQVVDQGWSTYDKNGDGKLSQAEFGAWMVALKEQSDPATKPGSAATKQYVASAFAQADKDKSRSVSKTELASFLGRG